MAESEILRAEANLGVRSLGPRDPSLVVLAASIDRWHVLLVLNAPADNDWLKVLGCSPGGQICEEGRGRNERYILVGFSVYLGLG